MIKAYADSGVPQNVLIASDLKQTTTPSALGASHLQPPAGPSARKKSKTSAQATRKRKRLQGSSPQSQAMKLTGTNVLSQSNRGLSDATEQLRNEIHQPDNGILQLVINQEQKDTTVDQTNDQSDIKVD